MSKTAIGIDFGGTTVKPGVVADGEIIARLAPIRTHDHAGHDSLLAAIREAIEELRRQHPEVVGGRRGFARDWSTASTAASGSFRMCRAGRMSR